MPEASSETNNVHFTDNSRHYITNLRYKYHSSPGAAGELSPKAKCVRCCSSAAIRTISAKLVHLVKSRRSHYTTSISCCYHVPAWGAQMSQWSCTAAAGPSSIIKASETCQLSSPCASLGQKEQALADPVLSRGIVVRCV